jgi:hypothetical protein
MPNATLCVPCLTEAGDVDPIRRLDEVLPDGVVVETYFTEDRRLDKQIKKMNARVADAEAFAVAVGDDSHLTVDLNQVLDVARPLSTEFLSEAPDRTCKMNNLQRTLLRKGLIAQCERFVA